MLGLAPTLALVALGCGHPQRATTPGTIDGPSLVQARGGLQTLGHHGATSSVPTITRKISSKDGGTLSVGRFTLTFAKHALARDTDITIEDLTNSTGIVQCRLLPEGTVFLAPVTLESDFSDLVDPAPYTMYWLMPTAVGPDVWVNVGGEPTADGQGIITTLEHFSIYAPGKAGW